MDSFVTNHYWFPPSPKILQADNIMFIKGQIHLIMLILLRFQTIIIIINPIERLGIFTVTLPI